MNIDQYEDLVARLMEGIRDADTKKAYNEVFDADTVATIYKLMDAGYIGKLGNVISTGKEANVFYGETRRGEPVAIKIYRINTTEFRHMWKYIEGDPRVKITKRNRRNLIFQWARREFKNLETAVKHNVRVPYPITHRKNIVIMEYIGDENGPAPLLKDYYPEDEEGFVKDLLNNLARLYYRAEIIHADLSEYNILVHNDRPVVIDMGQSMGWDHPLAYEFFMRDMNQLLKILRSFGIEEFTTADQLSSYLKALLNSDAE